MRHKVEDQAFATRSGLWYRTTVNEEIDPHSPLSQLSDGQLDVVRLVAELKTSKEIGLELGISHHTVDQRLKKVQAILGVASRFEAARLYAATVTPKDGVRDDLCGQLVYQRPELQGPSGIGDEDASPGELDRSGGRPTSTLHQPQAAYGTGFQPWVERRSWISVLLEAGRTNELTPTVRTLVIGVTTLLAIASLALMVNVSEGMSRVF